MGRDSTDESLCDYTGRQCGGYTAEHFRDASGVVLGTIRARGCASDGDQMHTRITKAVFPVAGLGTRFLPATKASPKEMLPIVDKPLIQYAAEEAVAAGIETLIFVTRKKQELDTRSFRQSVRVGSGIDRTRQVSDARYCTAGSAGGRKLCLHSPAAGIGSWACGTVCSIGSRATNRSPCCWRTI